MIYLHLKLIYSGYCGSLSERIAVDRSQSRIIAHKRIGMDQAQSRLHGDDWATQAQQSKRNQTHEETQTNEAGHRILEESIKSECDIEHQGATQERQQCSSFSSI